MTGLMQGKRGLIMGLANDKSLAWGIAKKLHEQGAELAFSYQGDALAKRVKPLAESLGSDFLIDCDVSDMTALDAAFETLKARWETIDFVVHAIGFSDKNELRGKYVDTSLDNFLMTMNISAYSLVAVTKRAEPMMREGGSILTLTYYGAEKVVPHYNVMGVAKAALETSVKYLANDLGPQNIRVNAISAGPVKTLAASGIGDLRYILKWNELNSPLRRNTTIEDVGGSALYFLSELSAGVTGEVHHVDSGYHLVGMKQEDAPDIALSRARSGHEKGRKERSFRPFSFGGSGRLLGPGQRGVGLGRIGGGIGLRLLAALLLEIGLFGFLDALLLVGGGGVDGREALLALRGDQFAELDVGAIGLFRIGLVDQLLGAARSAARAHRRAAHVAEGAHGFIGLYLVGPGVGLGRIDAAQRFGDAVTLRFGLACADRDLVVGGNRAGIVAVDDQLVDLLVTGGGFLRRSRQRAES